ncbi:MAG TPA: helix-turn-helix domain-containing protein [Actinomycetota bacterium]
MAAAFRSEIAALERLPGASQDDVLEGVRRSLLRWWRWLILGVAPPDEEFAPLRAWARARAGEGVRLEDLLRAFGIGGQVGWELIRRHARADEHDALLDAAGLLMRYVDRISAVVADTYLAERDLLLSEEERQARDLLERLTRGDAAPLDLGDRELAERLGVTVEEAYAPFVVLLPGQPLRRHAALAARLRRRGWKLAVTDGARVVGLTSATRPLDVADLGEGPDVLLVTASAAPRDDAALADAREDVAALAEHGWRAGLRGRLRAEEHPVELLVARSPGPAARLRARVLWPLAAPDHEELLRTLRAFVAHQYDRAATSEALHVHRNTLAYRLRRIERLTGLDLTTARDLAGVYLAVASTPSPGPGPGGPATSERRPQP